MPSAVATITTKKALSRARALGCDVHIANATGEVIVDHPEHKRVRMNVRRHDASLALRLLLRDIERDSGEHEMPKGQRISQETIAAIQEGRRNQEPVESIASRLGISAKTVGVYTPPELLRGGEAGTKPGSAGSLAARAAVAVMDPPTNGHVIRDATSREKVELQHTVVVHGRPAPSVRDDVQDLTRTGPPDASTSSEPDRETTEVSDRLVAFKAPTEDAQIAEPLDIADVVKGVTAEFTEYPTIRSLVARQHKYAELMKLAERSGDDDIQLLIMQKMELQPLEREAVTLWEATKGAQVNGNGRAH